MTMPDFNAAIGRIFAAFNVEPPAEETVLAWYDVAGNIPGGEAASWCVRQFIAGKSRLFRGDNVSRELVALYEEFKRLRQVERFHAQAAAPRQECPECTPGFPGFVRVRCIIGKLEYQQLYRCRCNHDPRFSRIPRYTAEEVR